MPRWFVSVISALCFVLAATSLAAQHADHPDSLDPHWQRERLVAAAQEAAAPAVEPAPKKEGDDKWSVDAPPGLEGLTRTVEIDVSEGTWLSLDVSPDGREIVFDLLGDLYLLPIEGGEAKAITSGLAWDMQPRFSPDGRSIAFTSDRAGGDNLWIIERDGSKPRQVSKESFRLLNSPAWTPDGEYLVGRKHFTGTRSLGSGEIWLYHHSGGGGLQLTKKPNDQKDVGEPVVSPDGKYVYFSQDTTPGPFFEYNKDPNAGIYSIRRLDRESGEIEDLVGGAGGAVRPTPSPDGKLLAFVRRVQTKTVLWVKDLASGEEWPIYDGLDRDMQETWAIHGVYPTFAWTPDNRSLVFWARGTFHRIDLATQVVSDVPFHVADRRTVVAAHRLPTNVAPEKFDVRLLRWVEVAPTGDRVLFQALGKIWLRDLPAGEPRRLTVQEDHHELFPTFSRDGRQIAFTTWDDRELGSVRVLTLETGEERALTTEPGHYTDPTFSPDGARVVFTKSTGGGLRSELWSREPGVYQVPVEGGTPVRVSRSGAEPHFGADPERVFLSRRGEDGRELFSLTLEGKDEQVHASSSNAGRFRVSPDGRWVAWQERFQAYVAPRVLTGKAVALSPDTKAVPVAQVSRDAGDFLHWSGDSKSLHWSLGPELFTRPLSDSFAFLTGAPDPLPAVPATGQPIGFSTAGDVPSGDVAIVGGRVITLAGPRGQEQVLDDGVVWIQGNRIVGVGRRGEVAVPPAAHVIDATGKTVMPGLVDVHWHGGQGSDDILPEQNWVNAASLAFGVTTLHDPSNDTHTIFAAAELQRAGLITAPRIYSTGTILYGAETPFMAEVDSLEDARSHLRRMKAVGAISVKSYNQPRREQRQQVMAAAREVGLMVVPEGGSLFQHNLTMVVDGHTGVEHSIPVAAIYADVRQLWGATGVGYTPTLGVGYGGLWGENYWYAKTEVWKDPRLTRFVPREELDARSRRRVLAADDDWNHFHNARVATELMRAGVRVNIGAHGQREGLAAHWEIWMLAQGGMKPIEALRAATIDGAYYLGMENDLGTLEVGKLADVLILSKDPLVDIRNSTSVETVVLNGRVFDAATMNQGGNHPRPREPFFWERGADGKLVLAPGR